MKTQFTILLLGAAIAVNAQMLTGSAPRVKTAHGILQGITESSGIRSFKGIAYALPPVGNLRWQVPQPPKSWKGVRVADHFGPQAMQRFIFGDMRFRSAGTSEDCLYLNVWTPAKTVNAKLPVLVYFYGGGFLAGDGSEYRYDGEALAKKGIVTVTVNYRLGVFGFMAHPELSKESPHHSSGNYGLMDQHAALVWVKKNIGAFGGDPAKVTIGGESAGSMSVSGQVASPLSKGLFVGAIAESGALLGNLSPVPLADGEKAGEAFAKKIGARSLADLRNLPADSLLAWSANMRFPVVIDGYFLPGPPQDIFAAGRQMDVALLAGWNTAESNYHAILGKNAATPENYKSALQALYGDKWETVLSAYPANTEVEVERAATRLASDRFIAFATWKFIYLQAKTGHKPVYRYLFGQSRPLLPGAAEPSPGAVHSTEIEYALGNLSTNNVYAWTPDDYRVSNMMQLYFANFIKTGNPNGPGLPQWNDMHSANKLKVMFIGKDTHAIPADDARYFSTGSFYNR